LLFSGFLSTDQLVTIFNISAKNSFIGRRSLNVYESLILKILSE
jgi:hypothetical protein